MTTGLTDSHEVLHYICDRPQVASCIEGGEQLILCLPPPSLLFFSYLILLPAAQAHVMLDGETECFVWVIQGGWGAGAPIILPGIPYFP